MSIFKCKMCGGDLEITGEMSVAECLYCGTKQTLPKLSSEKKTNLYDRANHFRRSNEYDKAAAIYENILHEDPSDAEAYWSLVLCRYGVEYVEDPSSHKRVPTVNRAQFTSIFMDEDYKSALRYADSSQKAVYEAEAKAIDEIQKNILAISQSEEPFDVFICYKETDGQGRRTPDSVLANDLYHQLTQEGFKVFFSRITLEDKLGSAYEPYIFAALNSSKVMVVLGTRPEYLNAIWVKNEWARYLALIKAGQNKTLIPAYKDMDPYDLPEEFSHLQAQDMSKLGFMQDLIRGVKRIVGANRADRLAEAPAAGGASIGPLLTRAYMFLEDGDWASADEYCNKVLDLQPECAEAYIGLLMVETKTHREADLSRSPEPILGKSNFIKACRFGGPEVSERLDGYHRATLEYMEEQKAEKAYEAACRAMRAAKTEAEWKAAAVQFEKIPSYKDAGEKRAECLRQAEIFRKNEIYRSASSVLNTKIILRLETAKKKFETIRDYKDSEAKIAECERKIEALTHMAEEERRVAEQKMKRKKWLAAATLLVSAACIILLLLFNRS